MRAVYSKELSQYKNTTDIFDEKIEEITQRAEALGLKQQNWMKRHSS